MVGGDRGGALGGLVHLQQHHLHHKVADLHHTPQYTKKRYPNQVAFRGLKLAEDVDVSNPLLWRADDDLFACELAK